MRLATSRFLRCLLVVSFALLAPASRAANLSVDGSQKFQVVDGMGVNLNVQGWDSAPFPEAIDLLVDVNGSSLVRVIRDPMNWVSSDSLIPALHDLDPVVLAQVYETPAMRDLWGALAYLNQKGIRGSQILLNFMGWTPVWLGGSGRYGAISQVHPGMEDEFATMIASLVYYGRRVKNLDFLLLSPTNEQDWNGLEGPQIGPTQCRTVLEALVAELDHMGLTEIRLVAPDTASEPGNYVTTFLASAAVDAQVDHLAFHNYGSATSPGTAYVGKNYWMTETAPYCSACDANGTPAEGEWEFASHAGDLVLQDLDNGFAAVLLWEAHDSFYYHHNGYSTWGMLARDGASYAPRKRFYVNGQINSFIRPGATRIAVSESLSGLGPVVAFQDSAARTFAIVGHVTDSSPVTIEGDLRNLPFVVPFLRHYQTSSALDLARQADVTVSAGAFSVTIPGATFFSLAWTENTPPVATILAPADSGFYGPGQTIALSGVGADAETPPDSLLYRWFVDLVSASGAQSPWAALTGATTSYAFPAAEQGMGLRQRVRLIVEDPQGQVSDTAGVTIWPEVDLAVANLALSPDPPIAGQGAYCTFTLSNAGRMPAPTSPWVLRAGDVELAQGDEALGAETSANLAVNVVFPTAGAQPLRVTVDSLGAVFETDETNNSMVYTVVPIPPNTPPVAMVAAEPLAGPAPLRVDFSGAASTDADEDSLTFDWTFGDGHAGIGRRVSYAYATVGDYVALLTVRDGRGGEDSASVAIHATVPVFPQTPVLDDFNRAEAMLSAPWIDQNERFWVEGNELVTESGDHYTLWGAESFGPDQEAHVRLSAIDGGGREHNLMLKTQGTTWTSGHVEVSYDALNSQVVVRTFTPPSTWRPLGTVSGVSFVSGDQFGARARVDGSVRVYRNGIEVGSASVASWPYSSLGGRIGLSVAGAPGARFDDFGGGTIDPEYGELLEVAPTPPKSLRLSTAFPNPTHGHAEWSLSLPVADEVGFRVLDLQGREVWSTPQRRYGAGQWSLCWDGAPVPNGVYFARVRVGAQIFLRRIAVVR